MGTRWPIGHRAGGGDDDIDSNRRRFGRLRPVPHRRRLRQDADNEATSSIAGTQAAVPTPTDSDLAFARNAASDVLTKGDKDSSQPWENPETGARGSVT